MFTAILIAIGKWVSDTGLTTALAERFWIVPALQTAHILGVAVVISGIAIINLRVLGIVETRQSLAAVLDRFLGPVGIAVGVLAVTGLLLIAAEPTRAPFRAVFWVKMGLIVVAALLTWSHRRPVFGPTQAGVGAPIARKAIAVAALLLWLAVIVAGRWIAYAEAWAGAPA